MSDEFTTDEEFDIIDTEDSDRYSMGPAAFIAMIADMASDGEPTQFTSLLNTLLTTGDWEQFKAAVIADRDDTLGPLMDEMDYDLSDDTIEEVKKATLRALKVIATTIQSF